ncbi:hypothetical protein [Nocardiopsis dassonvillei]|uniref:hypothetical protein n=1 Tax=Nocardiopsis dassonvillei TaxID=2014 RepID=UPI00366E47E3
MRLKNYLIVAGFAAAALFGGSPAWADDAIAPSAAPVPAECAGLPAEDGSAAPAEESGAGAPSEESGGWVPGAGAEPCDDPTQPGEEPTPPAEEPTPAEEDEAAEQEQWDREREIEEAAAPVPMPADPNYTG